MAENGLNEKQASKVKLYTVALIYTFSIGFSFLAIKKCVPYADSLTILAYRYDFALLGVIVWFSVCRLLGKQQKQKFMEYYLGREVEVLFEEQAQIHGKTYWIGHTREYLKVAAETKESLENCIKIGKIGGFVEDGVFICAI